MYTIQFLIFVVNDHIINLIILELKKKNIKRFIFL